MNKQKSSQLQCPCCRCTVYQSGLRQTLGRVIWIWGITRKLQLEDLQHGQYQWACDACLSSGRAIQGNPEQQLYCDFDPYLAYFNIEKTCENCGKEYVFSKQEQFLWYEQFKFWVQSKPKYCPECRKIKRQKKNLSKELSSILARKESLQIEDMERLSVLYREINRPDKSNYYQNLIKKYKGRTATNTPLNDN